jgi:hypothetical protein
MFLWANDFLGNRLSGQMSFWANVFWANVFRKCRLHGQMSFWANVVWANVLLGERRMGKWLRANVSGQTSYGQMSWNHSSHAETDDFDHDTFLTSSNLPV